MPRIAASSVAEHVAQQEELVFDEAIRLFVARGYAHVTLGDIADAVGLKRNSLYRYFPNKAAILARWFAIELDRQLERSRSFLERDAAPLDLILAWADDQLDYAARPEHQLMSATQTIEPDLAPEFRAQLIKSHTELMAPLRMALQRAGLSDPAMLEATVELISGMILAAARVEQHSGLNDVLRGRLHHAIRALAH